MKNACKRITGILTAVMYVAVYYAVAIIVQLIYILWQNSSGVASLSEIEINVTNGTHALSIISMIVAFWVYIILGKIRKRPLDKTIDNSRSAAMVNIMAVCLALGLRFLVTVYHSLSQNVELLKRSIDEASVITPQLTGTGQIAAALFSMLVVAPIFEELLFRGIVMRELMRVMRPWAANFVQALLFGAAHAVLFQSIFTFVVGIIFGIVYNRTKSIKTVAICHAAFNVSVILAQNEMTAVSGIIMTIAGILLSACSMLYIIASSKQ